MSQNQSYFWQTTRHNVYLKRSAKFHLLMALMTMLTFSTVCLAEMVTDSNDGGVALGAPTHISAEEADLAKAVNFDAANANEIPNTDDAPTSAQKKPAGFVDAFTASISVILFTELGDKTFFIAAIMAMSHPRLIVFTGAISALALMTVLSVFFGMAATIIPKVYTYYISTALFAIFGLKMIYDGYKMKATDVQDEIEEVRSDLRKREDELMRAARGKLEDSDVKRKNSNSDKEDPEDPEELRSIGSTSTTATPVLPHNGNNLEMKRRQRKQLNNNNFNNNNGCELNNLDDAECKETDVFLGNGGSGAGNKQLPSFHSSPALTTSSASVSTAASNQKINLKNNCDEFSDSSVFKNNNSSGDTQHNQRKPLNGDGVNVGPMVHSASAAAALASSKAASVQEQQQKQAMNKVNGTLPGGNDTTATNTSIKHGLSSHSLNSAAGQSNGELKQIGGSKKRLERDVSASLVQDPESGMVRKNSKKTATYLTTRVLMQAFTMTFLAEWGDRSQLTTIILAASKDVYGVIVGGVLGHSICTGLAVIGGRLVAAKISVRMVTIMGGVVFLGFAAYALIVKPDDI